jgi:hypothetical protein
VVIPWRKDCITGLARAWAGESGGGEEEEEEEEGEQQQGNERASNFHIHG